MTKLEVDEKKYLSIVKKAKLEATVLKLTGQQRMKIAEFAVQACEILHGGRSEPTRLTLKRFSDDIGINKQTLYEWVRIKRMVFDKLDKENKPLFYKTPSRSLNGIMKRINITTEEKEVNDLYSKVLNEPKSTARFSKYLAVMDTILYNLTNFSVFEEIEVKTLELTIKKAEEVISAAREAIKIKSKKYPRVKRRPARKSEVWSSIEGL